MGAAWVLLLFVRPGLPQCRRSCQHGPGRFWKSWWTWHPGAATALDVWIGGMKAACEPACPLAPVASLEATPASPCLRLSALLPVPLTSPRCWIPLLSCHVSGLFAQRCLLSRGSDRISEWAGRFNLCFPLASSSARLWPIDLGWPREHERSAPPASGIRALAPSPRHQAAASVMARVCRT